MMDETGELPWLDDSEGGMTETMAIQTIDHLFQYQSLSELMDFLQKNKNKKFATYGNYQEERNSYTYEEIYNAIKNFIQQFDRGIAKRSDVLSALKKVPILSTATSSRSESLGRKVVELWSKLDSIGRKALITKHRTTE